MEGSYYLFFSLNVLEGDTGGLALDRDKRSLPGRGDRLLLSNEFLLLFLLDLEMKREEGNVPW